MWGDFGYFEGDQLGKPYDLKLLRRFLGYARPYRWLLAFTSLLILVATGTDLVLPYLTKVAIDRYIVATVQEVEVNQAADARILALVNDQRPLLTPTGLEGVYFLTSEKARQMDPQVLNRLQKAGVIKPKNHFLIQPGTASVTEVISKHPKLFRVFPRVTAIAVEDMSRLDRNEAFLLRGDDLAALGRLALLAGLVLLLGYFLDFTQIMLLEFVGQRLAHDVRQDLLSHVLEQSVSFHDRNLTGRLVARLTNDVQNLSEMLRSVTETFFKDAFILAGIVILLLYINTTLALITFILLPPVILVSSIFGRQARDVFRSMRTKVAQINGTFAEAIAGIRILQAFRREKTDYQRFQRLNHENYLLGIRQIKVFALFMPVIEILAAAALALIIWYGGWSVIREIMTLGAVVAFISYTRKFFQPIRDLAEKYNILQSAMASLERIFRLMDHQETLPQAPVPVKLTEGGGSISFERVEFAYQANEPVLKGVSFEVKPGETLAIIGATGAGKTSIINLLLRFYDPTAGRILVDGVDLRRLSITEHRQRIGLVMQDVFLFAGTVRENIALSEKGLSLEKVQAAARAVGAEDFILALPLGYEQPLGEGGLSLSVGQRQLLSFARVLAQDSRILVLDEATALIDSETEKLIEAALRPLTAGRTSIVIAHRLSTIRRADRILVLHHGRVSETGTHTELLAKKGIYFQLHQLQFGQNMLAGAPGS